LGAGEAEMMQQEKLFTKVGDVIPNFFGLPYVQVTGILESTGTPLDNLHLLTKVSVNGIKPGGKVVILSNDAQWKYFFITDSTAVVPELINNQRNQGIFKPVADGFRTYLPIVVGVKEAQMMQKEKIFTKVGDKIDNLFGNNAIVAAILPATNTLTDYFHYVGPEFNTESK
jgi:hypothetical protein